MLYVTYLKKKFALYLKNSLWLILCSTPFFTSISFAQSSNFPNKTIKIYVPFPAGGTADILPRILAEKLSKTWTNGVVVENKSGAGGNIGAEFVFNSEPDGHTLLASPPGPLAINQSLYKKLNYDSSKFIPITVMAAVPNVLVVSPKFPANNVQELIAYAKANPGRVNFASQGNGSTSHLTAMMFQSMAGITMTHVPYKGTTPALTDIMGGQVDVFFDNLSSSVGHHKAGKLRILGVADSKRSQAIPEVPTIAESGVKNFSAVTWFGIVAPPGTPDQVVKTLNQAFTSTIKLPEVQKSFSEQGATPVGGSLLETATFIKAESEKWSKVVHSTKTTLD
jgi:tripartite-type tricarboxylate transporter receptor subunit TctC